MARRVEEPSTYPDNLEGKQNKTEQETHSGKRINSASCSLTSIQTNKLRELSNEPLVKHAPRHGFNQFKQTNKHLGGKKRPSSIIIFPACTTPTSDEKEVICNFMFQYALIQYNNSMAHCQPAYLRIPPLLRARSNRLLHLPPYV